MPVLELEITFII